MINCNSTPEPCIFFMPENKFRGNSCGGRLGNGRLKDLNGCHKHPLNPDKVETKKREYNKKVDIEKLKELALEGKTMKEIAAILKVHHTTVWGWKTKLNINIKKETHQRKIDIDKMRKMAAAGKYRRDMAKEFGCDITSIYNTAREHGIKITTQPKVAI